MVKKIPGKIPESKILSPNELKNAIQKIERRIDELRAFDVVLITEHSDAKAHALENKINQTLADIFGHDTVEYRNYAIWSLDTLPLIMGKQYPISEVQQGYKKGIDNTITKLESLRETLEEKFNDIEACVPVSQSNVAESCVARLEKVFKKFHLVVRQLRNRHDHRQAINIEDEYDVQDLLHAFLLIDFDDIRPEEWTPSYAGSSSRMDFLLKNEQIVIEVKKTRNGLGAKEIGEQLIIDIEKYRNHPDCKLLICFVYDPEGKIMNPKGIEHDLNRTEGNITVQVIIVPTGL